MQIAGSLLFSSRLDFISCLDITSITPVANLFVVKENKTLEKQFSNKVDYFFHKLRGSSNVQSMLVLSYHGKK